MINIFKIVNDFIGVIFVIILKEIYHIGDNCFPHRILQVI